MGNRGDFFKRACGMRLPILLLFLNTPHYLIFSTYKQAETVLRNLSNLWKYLVVKFKFCTSALSGVLATFSPAKKRGNKSRDSVPFWANNFHNSQPPVTALNPLRVQSKFFYIDNWYSERSDSCPPPLYLEIEGFRWHLFSFGWEEGWVRSTPLLLKIVAEVQ